MPNDAVADFAAANPDIAIAFASIDPTRGPEAVREARRLVASGRIHGLKDSLVAGVVFENCAITAQRGLTIENARDVDTSGLKLTVSEGEPIVRR